MSNLNWLNCEFDVCKKKKKMCSDAYRRGIIMWTLLNIHVFNHVPTVSLYVTNCDDTVGVMGLK